MVYLLISSFSVCTCVDQSPPLIMPTRKPSSSNFPVCHRSQSAAIDVFILIAVITASGFLLFPYLKLITLTSIHIFSHLSLLLKAEILHNPIVYGSLALTIFCAAISTWLVILLCTMHRCGKPNCKGLRKPVELFDIQLETQESLKTSNYNGHNRSIFQLPRVHHRQLEAELKKMAPPNGRAVLVFRATCGCSVRRLVVSGPKKQQHHRKIKK